MRVWGRCVVFVLTAGFLAGAAGDARAQPGEGGAAAAESLFQEARKLMDAKRYGEACPKLAASHKLAPAVGTLLNLADCYERNGQLASAWVRFHEAIALAQRLGRADREKTATERADKLEPRLIKLTIKSRESGLEGKLDGNVLDSAALGTAVPVDAGKHTIDASAKGKKPFATILDVSDRARTPSVEIPALEPDGEAKGAPPPPPPDSHPPDENKSDGSTQRILGIAGMGLGGAGVILGSIFGLRTSSKWSEAKDHCTGIDCDRTGVELAAQAKNAGTVSTISFIAGGVFLAGGAVLFFTAPSGSSGPKKRDTTLGLGLGLGLGSVSLGGAF
ncbi:hypothetical protein BH11MYX4_BH11MYX4_39790 [soil metagenome]